MKNIKIEIVPGDKTKISNIPNGHLFQCPEYGNTIFIVSPDRSITALTSGTYNPGTSFNKGTYNENNNVDDLGTLEEYKSGINPEQELDRELPYGTVVKTTSGWLGYIIWDYGVSSECNRRILPLDMTKSGYPVVGYEMVEVIGTVKVTHE